MKVFVSPPSSDSTLRIAKAKSTTVWHMHLSTTVNKFNFPAESYLSIHRNIGFKQFSIGKISIPSLGFMFLIKCHDSHVLSVPPDDESSRSVTDIDWSINHVDESMNLANSLKSSLPSPERGEEQKDPF